MSNFKKFETLEVKQDAAFGLKKGSLCIFSRDIISSGYNLCEVIAVDVDFYSYFKEHNFKNLKDYINSQQKSNIFKDSYWTNPFTVYNVYPEDLKKSDINIFDQDTNLYSLEEIKFTPVEHNEYYLVNIYFEMDEKINEPFQIRCSQKDDIFNIIDDLKYFGKWTSFLNLVDFENKPFKCNFFFESLLEFSHIYAPSDNFCFTGFPINKTDYIKSLEVEHFDKVGNKTTFKVKSF